MCDIGFQIQGFCPGYRLEHLEYLMFVTLVFMKVPQLYPASPRVTSEDSRILEFLRAPSYLNTGF